MKVEHAMHKGAEWVSPGTPVPELARLMRDRDIGALPVGENDRLVGMVTDRDIVCRCLADGKDPAAMTARDIMTKGIFYCRSEDSLEDAIHIMEEKKVRRLAVIDSGKRMVGILSLGDISHAGEGGLGAEVLLAVSGHHA